MGSAPKASILVVEDERDIRESLAEILEDFGFSTSTAEHGFAALTQVREGFSPDAILSDINMPKMDGLTFQSRVKELAPTAPLVFLTGFAAMGNISEALRQGAFDFLEKPQDLPRLGEVMERAVEYGAQLRQIEKDLDDLCVRADVPYVERDEFRKRYRDVLLMRASRHFFLRRTA